jgi:hypothetical protein
MKLSQWNRYRNDTFKDRREDELAFIPGESPATEGGVVEKLKAPQTYAAGSNALNKTAGTLLDVAPMLDFAIFTNTKHSAANVAAMKRSVLAKYGVMPRDISLATEDGASNNKAAAKILRQPFKVCFPHDLQRAVLFSTGMTGKPNQNKDLATAIGSMSRMAAAPQSDIESDGSESSTTEEVEEDGDED